MHQDKVLTFVRQTTMEICHFIWYVVHHHHWTWWGRIKGDLGRKSMLNWLKHFLTAYMEGASKTNHLGKTPLDLLMETNAVISKINNESLQGVELRVNANPKEEATKLFTKEKMYPFMLAAFDKKANLSCTFSMLLIFVAFQDLDDLGSRITVQKIKRRRFSRKWMILSFRYSSKTNLIHTWINLSKNSW